MKVTSYVKTVTVNSINAKSFILSDFSYKSAIKTLTMNIYMNNGTVILKLETYSFKWLPAEKTIIDISQHQNFLAICLVKFYY